MNRWPLRRPAWLFAVLLLVSCTEAPVPPKPATPLEQFQAYWTEFRAAALRNDGDKLASMTAFPFRTRGADDDSPTATHDRASFLLILDRLLDQDAGMRAEPETMRQFIDRNPTVMERNLGSGGNSARVGTFEFAQSDGKWQFTRAFLEE